MPPLWFSPWFLRVYPKALFHRVLPGFFKSISIREEATTMEQYRQMYVKRELRRRRIEKRNRVISKVKEGLASIALVIGAEVFMFALILM